MFNNPKQAIKDYFKDLNPRDEEGNWDWTIVPGIPAVIVGLLTIAYGGTYLLGAFNTNQGSYSKIKEYYQMQEDIFGYNGIGYGLPFQVAPNNHPLADKNNNGKVSLEEKVDAFSRAGVQLEDIKDFPHLTFEQLKTIKDSY